MTPYTAWFADELRKLAEDRDFTPLPAPKLEVFKGQAPPYKPPAPALDTSVGARPEELSRPRKPLPDTGEFARRDELTRPRNKLPLPSTAMAKR